LRNISADAHVIKQLRLLGADGSHREIEEPVIAALQAHSDRIFLVGDKRTGVRSQRLAGLFSDS
jgi:hypothetical protein